MTTDSTRELPEGSVQLPPTRGLAPTRPVFAISAPAFALRPPIAVEVAALETTPIAIARTMLDELEGVTAPRKVWRAQITALPVLTELARLLEVNLVVVYDASAPLDQRFAMATGRLDRVEVERLPEFAEQAGLASHSTQPAHLRPGAGARSATGPDPAADAQSVQRLLEAKPPFEGEGDDAP